MNLGGDELRQFVKGERDEAVTIFSQERWPLALSSEQRAASSGA
jgi:hypothetical protein